MCAFVSGLLSNTVIILFVYVIKAMTNNQPKVCIPGHKLLVFWGIRVAIFTTVY